MARKMIAANRELFNKLRQALPPEVPPEEHPIPRWIETTVVEKQWLREIKFKTDPDIKFGGQSSLALASLDTSNYLIAVALELELPTDEFEEVPLNAGLFCAAVEDLGLEPISGAIVGLELLENIFTPVEKPTAAGIPYSLDSVRKFFPPIRVFQISSESPLLKPEPILFRVALFAVTTCPSLITLAWTKVGLENARAISASQKTSLPFELILRAITERKNIHAFLELYRCIEFLFPFPKINKLKEKLLLTLSTSDISEQVENVLGWRPNEDSALQQLFKALPGETIASLQQALSLEKYEGDISVKVADVLYRLRNDCVHFRPTQRASNFQVNVKWELLLQTMLSAINSLYTAHSNPD